MNINVKMSRKVPSFCLFFVLFLFLSFNVIIKCLHWGMNEYGKIEKFFHISSLSISQNLINMVSEY